MRNENIKRRSRNKFSTRDYREKETCNATKSRWIEKVVESVEKMGKKRILRRK